MKKYMAAYRKMAKKEEGKSYYAVFGQPSIFIFGWLIPTLVLLPAIIFAIRVLTLPGPAVFLLWFIPVAGFSFYLILRE